MFRLWRNEKRLVGKTLFCFWLRQNEFPNPKPSRFLFATRSVAKCCKLGLGRTLRACRGAKRRGNLFPKCRNCKLAEGVGFEPTVPLRALRFSRPTPSTTQPPLPISFQDVLQHDSLDKLIQGS